MTPRVVTGDFLLSMAFVFFFFLILPPVMNRRTAPSRVDLLASCFRRTEAAELWNDGRWKEGIPVDAAVVPTRLRGRLRTSLPHCSRDNDPIIEWSVIFIMREIKIHFH